MSPINRPEMDPGLAKSYLLIIYWSMINTFSNHLDLCETCKFSCHENGTINNNKKRKRENKETSEPITGSGANDLSHGDRLL